MAFTQTDLDAIDRAIASGELSVSVGERRVIYRSMDELMAARSLVAAAIVAASIPQPLPYPRYQIADFSDD